MTPRTDQSTIALRPDPERTIRSLETLKIFFDPMRTRIIRTMADAPRTVQQIARELDVPFTRLYYHINMLEKNGIIRVVQTRNLSGAVEEKHYWLTARRFRIDHTLLTISSEASDQWDATLETLLDEIGSKIRDGYLITPAPVENTPENILEQAYLRLSPEKADELCDRMRALLAEYRSESNGSGDLYRLVCMVYPDESTTAQIHPPDDNNRL
jgi:DNA-binding transcriptional ArsR family regulator